MTTTSDKCREVAERLRELRHRTDYSEEVVASICEAIRIADPANTFRDPEDIYELLADLIDRPTCMNVSGHQDVFECSECRCKAELTEEICNERGEPFSVPLMPSFCPNCGARVTGGER